jgi:hypothetical protein
MGNGIGWAVEQMRGGRLVRRTGWNGKGMWLALQPGYPDGVPANNSSAVAFHIPEGTIIKALPYVVMRTASGEFVLWLCSQTDLLSADWEIAG